MSKRFFFTAAIMLLIVPALSLPVTGMEQTITSERYYSQLAGQGRSINVYNWGEYIADGSDGMMDINKAFEALTGIRVYYSTFATNEELYSKLRSGGASYDVIIPSDYMIGRMISEDMLTPLNYKNIPNYENIDPQFKNPAYDPENRFSVPYTWGYVGIIYNRDMVDEDEANTWDILWDERYLGQILMFSNPRDAFAIAQAKLGYSLNTHDPEELQHCLRALKEQKNLVQAYVMDEIFDKMLGGEAALAPYYAGDAVTMMEENDSLGFAVPRQVTNLFIDAACIPANAKNVQAAEMYINFLCEPSVSAANSTYIGYATPNLPALELLDDDFASNTVAYPPGELLQNTESFGELPRDVNLLMDQMWTELLSNDESYGRWIMPVFLFSAFFISILIHLRRTFQKKKQQNYFL